LAVGFSAAAAGEEDAGGESVTLLNKIVPEIFFTIPTPQRFRNVDIKDDIVEVIQENTLFFLVRYSEVDDCCSRRRDVVDAPHK
jgi:hypothetical protein